MDAANRLEAAGGDHAVVLYDDDEALVEHVMTFLRPALEARDAVVVVATQAHRVAFEGAAPRFGIDLAAAEFENRYVKLDADETLARLLSSGEIDAARFDETIGRGIEELARRSRHVRVFGEMVGLLCSDGRSAVALQLEDAWTRLARTIPFSLLCAYPSRAFFAGEARASLLRVCNKHTAVASIQRGAGMAAEREVDAATEKLGHSGTERGDAQLERSWLAAIVDSSDDAIVSKTLDGIVTSWNASAERLFGYSAREMLGQSISRLIPSDCGDDLAKILGAIRRGERVEHYETQRMRKDGQRIHVSLSVSPIRDLAGNIVGASKIARDVTQRLRYEEQLRKQRAAIDSLHRIALALSAERDTSRLLQSLCDAATELSGAKFGAFFYNALDDEGGHYVPCSVSGAPRDVFERLGSPRNTPLFAPTFVGEAVVRFDDVKQAAAYGRSAPHHGLPPGHLPIQSYLAVPVIGQGHRVFGALLLGHPEAGVFTQESEAIASGLASNAAIAIENGRLYEAERKLREEAEKISRAKDEFLAMLGHELRNPLAAVRNAVVAASLDPQRNEPALAIARRGAEQLSRLVDDLLDVARITQGKVVLRRDLVALNDIVERAVEMARPFIQERDHALAISLPERSPVVNGDSSRLEQVIVNLITNAAKFTPHGGHLEVSLQHDDSRAVLVVRDDGVGIDKDLLPRVFDLFAQDERALTRTAGGLGVGLTVVRRIVELHGGRVEAVSEGLGTGASFIVRLPALALAADVRSTGERSPRPQMNSARILIVEDNADAAEGLRMLLELRGHQVSVCHDGSVALECAQKQPPDLILIDIGLPGMNGYEVAQRFRSDPQFATTVLVALTGYGRPEDREKSLAAGFDRHLTKPVDPQFLMELVGSLHAGPSS